MIISLLDLLLHLLKYVLAVRMASDVDSVK